MANASNHKARCYEGQSPFMQPVKDSEFTMHREMPPVKWYPAARDEPVLTCTATNRRGTLRLSVTYRQKKENVTNVNSDQWRNEDAQVMSVDWEICNHVVKHEDLTGLQQQRGPERQIQCNDWKQMPQYRLVSESGTSSKGRVTHTPHLQQLVYIAA
ncbi:hypothetical protein BJV77DRAFT_965404 [Russula vinacea]|nr:hypothetical protein BJV77DRAFT_965404 [Russula vinacea]